METRSPRTAGLGGRSPHTPADSPALSAASHSHGGYSEAFSGQQHTMHEMGDSSVASSLSQVPVPPYTPYPASSDGLSDAAHANNSYAHPPVTSQPQAYPVYQDPQQYPQSYPVLQQRPASGIQPHPSHATLANPVTVLSPSSTGQYRAAEYRSSVTPGPHATTLSGNKQQQVNAPYPSTSAASTAAPVQYVSTSTSPGQRKYRTLGHCLVFLIIVGIVLGVVFGIVLKNMNHGSEDNNDSTRLNSRITPTITKGPSTSTSTSTSTSISARGTSISSSITSSTAPPGPTTTPPNSFDCRDYCSVPNQSFFSCWDDCSIAEMKCEETCNKDISCKVDKCNYSDCRTKYQRDKI
ncbi:hypothetical protein EDD11_000189 [Mortierella claussenii]|nr:hypothetical protein EDD11_000189 [Mortierella claussenii]